MTKTLLTPYSAHHDMSNYISDRVRDGVHQLTERQAKAHRARAMAALAALGIITSCGGETINVGTPPPPASYLVCDALPEAPDLDPLQAITLADGAKVYAKPQVDTRDSAIARWIVDLRGAHFECWNQLQRVREYYRGAE